jgi:hypothetical protein
MTGAVFNMEADVEGGFHYGGGFVLHGGGLYFFIYMQILLFSVVVLKEGEVYIEHRSIQ